MAKLGVKSIRGNVSPLIGQATFYEVHEFYPGTPIADHNKVKWNLYAIENGKPRLLDGGPTKFGRRVSYEFPQKWYGESLMIEAYVHNAEGKAPPGLIVKPVKGPKKVTTLTIKDGNENTISTAPKYGEHITAIVTTDNMVGDEIDLAIWERDTISSTGHDAESNALLWNKKFTVSNKNGVVKQKILLDTGMMAKANKSFYEGSEHEYYLVVKSGNMQTRGTQTVAVSNSEIVLSPSQRTNPPRPVPRPTQPQEEEKSNIETITAPIIVAAKVGWDMIMDKLFKPVTVNLTQVQGCEGKFCIKKGDPKSELIREINIRLAGFGGNVPTDEFTDRTEKMIKQFQRDYMKVPETGKVCGNVLKAIDDFSVKFDISTTFWEQLKCSCNTKNKTATSALRGISEMNKCTGFGDHTGKSTYKPGKENIEAYHRYEYPGIHRSLLFGFKAMLFYLSIQETYSFRGISSGYRCRFKNFVTTNHQGKALDIQFSKGKWDIGGPEQRNLAPLRDLRDTLFHKYLDAKTSWVDADDKFSLEPIDLIYKKDGSIDKNYTYSWIHLDVREFKTVYLEDKYFCKNGSELNGQSIILLAKDGGHANTCSCLKGVAAVEAPSKTTTGCYCTDELTEEILQKVAPHATKANVTKFVDGFNKTFTKYNINSCLKKIHFLGQVIQESGSFRYNVEQGNEAYLAKYNGWHGRGLIQLTTKGNYEAFEKHIGEDFTSDAAARDKVMESPYAVYSAGWFWENRSLNNWSDKNDFIYITYRVNGGFNHVDDRLENVKKGFEHLYKSCKNDTKKNTDYKFPDSKGYDDKKCAFAWGLWHDPLFDKKGCSKNKDLAIEGYQRYLDLTTEADSTINYYGIKDLNHFADLVVLVKKGKKNVKQVKVRAAALKRINELKK